MLMLTPPNLLMGGRDCPRQQEDRVLRSGVAVGFVSSVASTPPCPFLLQSTGAAGFAEGSGQGSCLQGLSPSPCVQSPSERTGVTVAFLLGSSQGMGWGWGRRAPLELLGPRDSPFQLSMPRPVAPPILKRPWGWGACLGTSGD